MCQFFYWLDIFFFLTKCKWDFYTCIVLWWSTKYSSLNQISSYNPFSIDARIRASLFASLTMIWRKFCMLCKRWRKNKRKYIAVKAAWPPRSFLCNVLYKFYGIVIIKQTPYAGLFPSICYNVLISFFLV